MLPSPVSCAKPPSRAPRLSARIAFALRAPKLSAEMLNTDAEYGCVQSGPPIETRNPAGSGSATGCIECPMNSWPAR